MNFDSCDVLNAWTLPSVEVLLSKLGVKNVSYEGEKLRCSCPRGLFSTKYHLKGNLNNPSGVISIGQKGDVRLHCFSCMEDGEYIDLEIYLQELLCRTGFAMNDELIPHVSKRCGEAMRFINHYHIEGDWHSVSNCKTEPETIPVFEPYPEAWLESRPSVFNSSKAMNYLYGRGLSDSVIKELDIRYQYWSKGDFLYVCFPVRNHMGQLAGLRGRCTADYIQVDGVSVYNEEGWGKLGYKVYKHFPFKPQNYECSESYVWFRENCIDLALPCVIVEGQFDVAAILPFYKNVTCLFKASASSKKLAFFRNSAGIIWLTDNVPDGSINPHVQKGRESAEAYCKANNIPFLNAYYPQGVKDAGECSAPVLEPVVMDAVAMCKSLNESM